MNLRPVYPLAVRVPGFFKRANPQFARYVVLDSSRVAKHENIPFRFPRPDPIVQDMTTLDVAENQPYIHRLTRLGAAAQLEGRSLAFADAISRVLWDGSVSGWNEGDHLASAAAAAGFDLAAMDAAISADPDRYEQVIAGNEQRPCGFRPLGRADFRVRERAVLRPGPYRPADLADGKQGPEPPLRGDLPRPDQPRRARKFHLACRMLRADRDRPAGGRREFQ